MNSQKIKLYTEMHNFNKIYYKNLLNTLLKYKTKQKKFHLCFLELLQKRFSKCNQKSPAYGRQSFENSLQQNTIWLEQ